MRWHDSSWSFIDASRDGSDGTDWNDEDKDDEADEDSGTRFLACAVFAFALALAANAVLNIDAVCDAVPFTAVALV